MRKIKIKREKLFDGFEEEALDKLFMIEIEGKKIEINLKNFYNKSLYNLNENLLNSIVKNENFIINKFNNLYYSTDNLESLYTMQDDYLIILSYGELQPARYNLYMESVCNISK